MSNTDFHYVLIHNRIIHKLPKRDPIKGYYIPIRLQFNLDDTIISLNIYERTCFSWFDEILKEIKSAHFTPYNKNWMYLSKYIFDNNDLQKWLHRPFKACKICGEDIPNYDTFNTCVTCHELIGYDKVMTNICCSDATPIKEKWLNSDHHKMVENMLVKLYGDNKEGLFNHYIT